jgi:hypothetical protein
MPKGRLGFKEPADDQDVGEMFVWEVGGGGS